MSLQKNGKRSGLITIAVILCGVFFLTALYFTKLQEKDLPASKGKIVMSQKQGINKKDITGNKNKAVKGDIIIMPTIDYNHLQKDKTLKQLMVSRKEGLGIKKSLDMIVNSDESFKIGDVQISMRDILENAFIKDGEVFEEKIYDSGAILPQKIKPYGIYVVQPGDNIWNIHFNILKEFYGHHGIHVTPRADEPIDQGKSSGVGKILKFSETLVIIYNLIEKKVDSNIDIIEPLSKIVVYNVDEVFSLLQEINYHNIDRIQFDGKTIWIPAKKI
ncbi:hypothetical protein [Desulfobacula phenolica]|uniref:Uncharacterized protein n=1 Tax=Desulfobacula phenolica TaxID=90732 RepID=A0A1H2DPQ1_9BACT|nr:hypothetical protein [Desulfobacula phenolica]SDT84754.1 hypothetical protein SAMN04487931_101373 [Desulfobacula phenolica]